MMSVLCVLQLQQEQLNCGAAHLQHPLALRRPDQACADHAMLFRLSDIVFVSDWNLI